MMVACGKAGVQVNEHDEGEDDGDPPFGCRRVFNDG